MVPDILISEYKIGFSILYLTPAIPPRWHTILKVCSLIGRLDIKIYAGSERPIKYDLVTADHVHGKTGLDIEGEQINVNSEYKIEELNAIDFIIKTCHEVEDSLYLCPTGPLTNIA